jgi:hypothetical protein
MISLKGHIKGNLGAFGSLTGALGKKQEQMELMLSSLYGLQYFLPAPVQNTVIDQMHLVQNEHRIIEHSQNTSCSKEFDKVFMAIAACCSARHADELSVTFIS